MKGNKFEFFGANHSETNIKELISNQMNNIYFPVTIKEFSAKLSFKNITENSFYVDDLHIQTISLNHPGGCLGYRVQHKNKSFCYVTDNELYLENSPQYNQQDVDRLIHFIKDADLAIMDATYSNKAYPAKIGWGHSSVGRVVDVASKANVKLLCLHHHDLDNTDRDIHLKLEFAKKWLKTHKSKTRCIAPKEEEIICI
jgi:phosphoribosyl 1,2-cyclic phosphodiesterase